MKIDISELANEIAKGLEDYNNDVIAIVNVKSLQVSKNALEKIKKIAPVQKTKGGGKYAKAFKITTKDFIAQPSRRIIHVEKPHYRLTHLLENGHMTRNGKRTSAQPHFAPVEAEVITTFESELLEVLSND